MKNNQDDRIRELEKQLITHSIFIETLIELLYEKDIINKSDYSEKIENKVRLIEQLKKNKKEKEDPTNPMFYGPHGET